MSEVLPQLVELSRYLGDPSRGFAILGEGNTSARASDDTFYVKASGTSMASIDAHGFVEVSIPKVTALLDDPRAGDEEVQHVFQEAMINPPEGRRPLGRGHPPCRAAPSARILLHRTHTHPTFTNMLLCSKHAEEAVAGRIFPDQIVSMRHKSVYVPYTDPGLPLAREVRSRFHRFVEEEGVLPRRSSCRITASSRWAARPRPWRAAPRWPRRPRM